MKKMIKKGGAVSFRELFLMMKNTRA